MLNYISYILYTNTMYITVHGPGSSIMPDWKNVINEIERLEGCIPNHTPVIEGNNIKSFTYSLDFHRGTPDSFQLLIHDIPSINFFQIKSSIDPDPIHADILLKTPFPMCTVNYTNCDDLKAITLIRWAALCSRLHIQIHKLDGHSTLKNTRDDVLSFEANIKSVSNVLEVIYVEQRIAYSIFKDGSPFVSVSCEFEGALNHIMNQIRQPPKVIPFAYILRLLDILVNNDKITQILDTETISALKELTKTRSPKE